MAEVKVTEVEGEKSEGDVLQALAGQENYYALVVFEFEEGDDGPEMKIRLSSNVSNATMKAMLVRAYEALP